MAGACCQPSIHILLLLSQQGQIRETSSTNQCPEKAQKGRRTFKKTLPKAAQVERFPCFFIFRNFCNVSPTNTQINCNNVFPNTAYMDLFLSEVQDGFILKRKLSFSCPQLGT
jgi:hypothetical protein